MPGTRLVLIPGDGQEVAWSKPVIVLVRNLRLRGRDVRQEVTCADPQ